MIALDTNIFIYHLEAHPSLGLLAKRLFQQIEDGVTEAVASMITFSEILTLPTKKNRLEVVQKYRELLTHFPHLGFREVSFDIAYEAAMIRGQYPPLKLMDAMILATAKEASANRLITEDRRLKVKGLPFEVQTLQEYFDG